MLFKLTQADSTNFCGQQTNISLLFLAPAHIHKWIKWRLPPEKIETYILGTIKSLTGLVAFLPCRGRSLCKLILYLWTCCWILTIGKTFIQKCSFEGSHQFPKIADSALVVGRNLNSPKLLSDSPKHPCCLQCKLLRQLRGGLKSENV